MGRGATVQGTGKSCQWHDFSAERAELSCEAPGGMDPLHASTRITALPHLAYQRGRLPRLSREKLFRGGFPA